MIEKTKSFRSNYNLISGRAKKKLDQDAIYELNQLYWETSRGLAEIAKEKQVSVPVLQRVITITRKEWEMMK